jgi:starch synthase
MLIKLNCKKQLKFMKGVRVLLATAELKSFKTRAGGLGPAVEELAYALAKLNCEVSVVSLLYKFKRDEKDDIVEIDYSDIKFEDLGKIAFWVGNEKVEARIKKIRKDNVDFYFLENEKYADLLYEGDNLKKAIFLARGTLELLKNLKIKVDVIHLNDGHTCLIPLFFNAEKKYKEDENLKKIKFVFTIHNAGRAYQQIFDTNRFSELGIGEEWREKVIWRNEINLTFLGIIFSEVVNTVSKDYAECLREQDEGLGELLREKGIFGITNGIDVNYWRMPEMQRVKSISDLKKLKAQAKIELLKEIEKRKNVRLDEDKLTIVIPRRFADQKGFEMIFNSSSIGKMCEERWKGGINAQLIVLGRASLGDPVGRAWVEKCKKLEKEFFGKFVFIFDFDEELAKKMYWGGDLLFYPSLPNKEPCGTGYMMAAVNGTPTLGTGTGGMAEKLVDFENGFVVKKENYNWDSFFEKLKEISRIFYEEREKWDKICWNAFNTDFDILKVANEYLEKVYFKALV